MNNTRYIETLLASKTMEEMLNNAEKISDKIFSKNLQTLHIENYIYTPDIAIEELGVDLDLMNQLIEDYVIQIIKSCINFMEFLTELQDLKKYTTNLDYRILRDLAHKNLGVAKNLRIEDAIKLLERIMKESDLDFITKCVECLFVRGVLLQPVQAYNTIRLIQVKESF